MNHHQRKFFSIIPLTVILILLSFSITLAQGQNFTITIDKVANNRFPVLDIYCSVVDAQGFPITNLTGNDFSILEDGMALSDLQVEPYKNEGQPLAIVIAIDTSTSMGYGSKPTPIVNAINTAKDFIAQLSDQDQVAIISFSNEVNVIQDLTTDRSKINEALDLLTNKGATALNDAVMKSIDLLKNRTDRRAIILLTDGRPEGKNLFTYDQVLQEASTWAIPIYPIGFGQVDQDQLIRMATISGGAAQIKPDSLQLTDAFTAILNIFRAQYHLEVTSAIKPDNLQHELGVAVNVQGGSVKASAKFIARQPIQLSFDQPKSGNTVHGKVQIQVKADSLNPISQLDFYLDQEKLQTVSSEPFTIEWDSTKAVTGEHVLKAVASDSLGFTTEISQPVIVELQRQDWIFWVIGLIALIAIAVIVPVGLRMRRKTVGSVDMQAAKQGSAILHELEGWEPNKDWLLSKEEITLGRKKTDNDITLKGIHASRSHAIIEHQGTDYIIKSRKSDNPVLVNGKAVMEKQLQNGDLIQMDESKFRFEDSEK
jgi:VWFA-related protein